MGVSVLMYHSIASESSTRFRQWTVAPKRFAAQMAMLAAEGYTPLTVTDYVNRRWGRGGALPPRPVVLTFDDGFADFATAAMPVLATQGFVATLYLTTQYIGSTSRWLVREGEAERSMLNWEQVREIHAAGIECAAHTHTHAELDVLSAAALREEIVHPRALLQTHAGVTATSFAYPFGYDSAAVRRAVRDAGYTTACAVRYRPSYLTDNPLALARLIVTADTTTDDFAALITGRVTQVAPVIERTRAFAWQRVRRLRRILQSSRRVSRSTRSAGNGRHA